MAIPKAISDDLNLKKGSEVIVQKLPQGDAFIVKKAVRDERVKKTSLDTEFKKWLKEAIQEDAEILDELALR